MIKELYKKVSKNLPKLIHTRAVFLMIGFIEAGTSFQK